jgi:serine/threonine-protein kinase HipA
MSTLDVYFREAKCARLSEDPQGRLQLRYLDTWIEQQGIPVSIRLPVRPEPCEHEQVAPFVAAFLPEGAPLRERIERLLHVDSKHDFGLLAALGRECAGALSFCPEGEGPAAKLRYAELSDSQFDEWREFAHQQPLQFQDRTLRLSLPGEQSKTALYFDEHDNPYLPLNGGPTTHILKPRIPGCRPSSIFVELITMRIARAVLGENRVPATDVWRNCYRVRRFDRPPGAPQGKPGVIRLHQEDLCLALGRMPTAKYESASEGETLLPACFQLIDALGEQGRIRSPAVERMRLLDQVILNVLLHNPDAHLKNYALLYSEEGGLEIAPLYDCLCTSGLAFESGEANGWAPGTGPAAHTRDLSLRIGEAAQIDQVRMADWEQLCEQCGFTRAFARRRVRLLAERLEQALRPTVDAILEATPAAESAAAEIEKGVGVQVATALGLNRR